jgi:hypothetical protein
MTVKYKKLQTKIENSDSKSSTGNDNNNSGCTKCGKTNDIPLPPPLKEKITKEKNTTSVVSDLTRNQRIIYNSNLIYVIVGLILFLLVSFWIYDEKFNKEYY